MDSFAERFKYLRNLARLSQAEFAHMIKLSQGRLSDIERGKNKPSADTLVAVSEFFNISASWLLQGTGKPPTRLCSPYPEEEKERGESLTQRESALLGEYRRLGEAEKKQLWLFLDFLAYAQRRNENLPPTGFKELEG